MGKAECKRSRDRMQVEGGDFLWLLACYAGKSGRFHFLLHEDVDRRALLHL